MKGVNSNDAMCVALATAFVGAFDCVDCSIIAISESVLMYYSI